MTEKSKTIIATAAILVDGKSIGIGDEVSTDIETADFLIRHGRAAAPDSSEAAAAEKAAKAQPGAGK